MSVPGGTTRLFFGGGGGSGSTNNGTGNPANGAASSGASGGGLVVRARRNDLGRGHHQRARHRRQHDDPQRRVGRRRRGRQRARVREQRRRGGGRHHQRAGRQRRLQHGRRHVHRRVRGAHRRRAARPRRRRQRRLRAALRRRDGQRRGRRGRRHREQPDFHARLRLDVFVRRIPDRQPGRRPDPRRGRTERLLPAAHGHQVHLDPARRGGRPRDLHDHGHQRGRQELGDERRRSPTCCPPIRTSLSRAPRRSCWAAARRALSSTTRSWATPTPSWGNFTIPGGGSVAITFVANVAGAVAPGTYQNPATVTYLDPTRTAAQTVTPGGTYTAGGVVGGSNYNSASTTNEDVTVVHRAHDRQGLQSDRGERGRRERAHGDDHQPEHHRAHQRGPHRYLSRGPREHRRARPAPRRAAAA